MSINILIVDGNEAKISEDYLNFGMQTQYEEYADVLNLISSFEINISIIHPANNDNYLDNNIYLDDYNGIIWTGSSLNIYDMTPPVTRQLELAKILLSKKNKIFGSCWGLQVLATVAGGQVDKNTNGLEAIVAKNITINDNGLNHKMYKDKPINFDSFCWHYDEIKTLPRDSIVLATNEHSYVQALTFHTKTSEIWASQYHPEFSPKWISGLMKMRKKILLEKKFFGNEKEFNKMFLLLSDSFQKDKLFQELNIQKSLIDDNVRLMELKNWLDNLTN